MTIGDRIRERRIELGLTQTDLANKCGYSSKSSICKIEKSDDDITLNTLNKISIALDIDPIDLMGMREKMEKRLLAYATAMSAMQKHDENEK
jgi:transcriptional regulator with XRE-family HTH domain